MRVFHLRGGGTASSASGPTGAVGRPFNGRPGSRLLLWTLLVVVLLPGAAPAREQNLPPLERVVIQLKWKHQFQFAGYYAALEKGFYREAGLEVELREAPDQGQPANAVLTGEAQFGIANSDLLLLRARGQPVVALAAIFQHSPLILLASAQSHANGRGSDTVHHLAGGRIMMEQHALELQAYLQSEQIALDRLTLVDHAFDPQALIEGRVDAISAYSTDEPFLLRQQGHPYRIFTPRAAGIDFYSDILFTTEEQIQRHPERVRALLGATLKGWAYALEHPREIIRLILERYSRRHSAEHLAFEARASAELILPHVVEIGYMNPGRWHHIADTYAQLDMIAPGFPLEGFLYDRNPRPNLVWLYPLLWGGILVVGLAGLITLRFYRMNRTIQAQVHSLTHTETELREAEKRYRVMAENSPFPIVIVTLDDLTIGYLNPRAARVLELEPVTALGQPAERFYDPGRYGRRLRATLDRKGQVHNFEMPLQRANGDILWVSLSLSLSEFEDRPAALIAFVDISERRAMEQELHRLATVDPLTGLYNRRLLMTKLGEHYRTVRYHRRPLCFLMIDLDHFKAINDRYGHDGGDQALRHAAHAMAGQLREGDLPARMGGEEFGILLADTTLDQGRRIAERIRRTIETIDLTLGGEKVHITTSVGVAASHPGENSGRDLLCRADVALYQAKCRGRNRVEVARETGTRDRFGTTH